MRKIYTLVLILFLVISCTLKREDFEGITKIKTDSETYQLLEELAGIEGSNSDEEVVCLTFVYPFNIYLYDENEQISGKEIVTNNQKFVQLLGQLEDEGIVGLSYPITATTESGQNVFIENNEELKSAIEACIEEQIIGYCNSILSNTDGCYWKVSSNTENKTYQNSLFDFYEDGTGIFYHSGNAYRTSWISLFIEHQLFVNIHLEDDTETTKHWNFNWNATLISDIEIVLKEANKEYTISDVCDQPNECNYVEFTACETEKNLANFIFDDYSDCILSFKEDIKKEKLNINYYETYEDAENKTNELNTLEYTNKENPQVIFVRIENKETHEINLQRIVIVVDPCDN